MMQLRDRDALMGMGRAYQARQSRNVLVRPDPHLAGKPFSDRLHV